VTSLFS